MRFRVQYPKGDASVLAHVCRVICAGQRQNRG
jgi:hypothetical protein